MTRGQMKAQKRINIMQGYGSPLRTYGPVSEDNQLDRAADRTAQRTDCYFYLQQEDLVANQSVYCAPKVYKPKDYYVVDALGNKIPLSRDNTRGMDDRYFEWQSLAAQDPPWAVVQDGMSYLTLVPTPSVSRTNGLIIIGFCVSTLPKSGHVNHQWDLDTDECPLPEIANEAVVAGMTFYALQQAISKDKSLVPLMNEWRNEWNEECKTLEVWAAKNYQSMRTNGYSIGNWWGGWGF